MAKTWIIILVFIFSVAVIGINTKVEAKSIVDCTGDKSIIDVYKEAYTRQHLDIGQLQNMINDYNRQCGIL